MDDTIRRLARLLGAQGVEGTGGDARFAVDGADGSKLKVSIDGARQRFMCVLKDGKGVTRADLDIAPVKKAAEDPGFPGRVTFHVGMLAVHVDSEPTLAVEVVTAEA